MSYRVAVPAFEGPLDLLLFLVKKNEINIYDIPIALITRQYLEAIEVMRKLDLNIASEFILMASYLIRLKVRMMLPPPESPADEDMEDPRTALAMRLEIYQMFKDVSEELAEIEVQERRRYPLQNILVDNLDAVPVEAEWEFGDLKIYDLMTALKRVIDEIPQQTYHKVIIDKGSIEEQMAFIRNLLKTTERTSFHNLMMNTQHRFLIVLTFLALLELCKRREVRIYQLQEFQDIWIYRLAAGKE